MALSISTLESETKDYKEFKVSQSQLYDNLRKKYKNDGLHIVITLSRKGPKIIECCPPEKRIEGLFMVTEFAIPFLMMKLKRGIKYHIIIVDDAVYYGSTLRNLIKELQTYKRILGLDFDIEAIVALIDKDAPKMPNIPLFGRIGYREGFGHYFVKSLMSQFRELHRCMEVEFPIITYEFDKIVDIDSVSGALKNYFSQVYINEYPEEKIITVLLPDDVYQFCKFRVYAENNNLHFAFMSPYNLPHDTIKLTHIMESMDSQYKKIWSDIISPLFDRIIYDTIENELLRNRDRSIIVLANFIFSFHTFIRNRQTLENMLQGIDNKFKDYKLPEHAIFLLTGDNVISKEIHTQLLEDAKSYKDNQLGNIFLQIPNDHQLYEEEFSPPQEERNVLVSHNVHMIRNSKSVEESISAIVFNQNLFMDRWNRYGMPIFERHLWYGYTHDILATLVKRNARHQIKDSLQKELHKSLDERIDQGCVVPQYITDPKTKQWVRVFRPGENEDLLLSHLGRFVIHIYNIINKNLNLGFVPLSILENVLIIIYMRFWENGLKEQFMFNIRLKEGKLVLPEDDNIEEHDILTYLKKMYILEISNEDEVTIAPRISSLEFLSNTTINIKIQDDINNLVNEDIFTKFKRWNINYRYSDSFFNYYLNENYLEDIFKRLVENHIKKLLEILTQIITEKKEKINNEEEDTLLESYYVITKYKVHPKFIDSIDEKEDYKYLFPYNHFVKYQHQFEVMILLINLIIGIYYFKNVEDIKEYLLDDNTHRILQMPEMNDIRKYIEELINAKSEQKILNSYQFPILMLNVLKKYCTDEERN